MEKKDWLFSEKVSVHGILLTKVCWFAVFVKYNFFPANFRVVVRAHFFRSMFIISLGILFSNLVQFFRPTAGERARRLAAELKQKRRHIINSGQTLKRNFTQLSSVILLPKVVQKHEKN